MPKGRKNSEIEKAQAEQNFREYQSKFIKKNYRAYSIRFSFGQDDDVISELANKKSITDYIRSLIRRDIAEKNGVPYEEYSKLVLGPLSEGAYELANEQERIISAERYLKRAETDSELLSKQISEMRHSIELAKAALGESEKKAGEDVVMELKTAVSNAKEVAQAEENKKKKKGRKPKSE